MYVYVILCADACAYRNIDVPRERADNIYRSP